MTSLIVEKTGTVSLTAGSKVLSGTLTAFSAAAVSGGMLIVDGVSAAIASVESDTAATLEQNWAGENATDADYVIMRSTAEAARLTNAQDKLSDLIAQLEGQVFFNYDAFGEALADRDAFDDEAKGFKFALISDGDAVLYVKASASSADWTDGVTIRGDKGDTGATGPAGEDGQAFDRKGAGAPDDGDGSNGETYLNTVNGDTYVKAAGTWGAPTGSIKGDQGIQGVKGDKGDTGQVGTEALLDSGTATGAGALELDLSTYVAAGYDRFRVVLRGLTPSVDGAFMGAQFSANGGSSYEGAGYVHAYERGIVGGSPDSGGSASDSYMRVTTAIGTDAGEFAEITIDIDLTATRGTMEARTLLKSDTGAVILMRAQGRLAVADLNALQFFMSGGTITSSWVLFGFDGTTVVGDETLTDAKLSPTARVSYAAFGAFPIARKSRPQRWAMTSIGWAASAMRRRATPMATSSPIPARLRSRRAMRG
ncbi:hypothetical protein OEG84_25015 [Hoeflea sp. G2-23]|uniref:Uncharacterized protein n=1 Tax=Hoeflea algicola TaxID=2983763 RepID=A0ABT3ZGD7_9HYPH|nr:hypothetical protein [Hoeflea algicola]MCY0150869.1 hypothetical protein [Hoeflea algicola]